MLTNKQRGSLYVKMMGKARLMGVHLLHKAFQFYRLDNPQEIFRNNV